MSVDQELSACVVGSGSCVEEGQGYGGDDDEAESEPVPSFTEALHAFESVRAFIHAHDITKETQGRSIILKGYYSI
jgi:hypothetical protein